MRARWAGIAGAVSIAVAAFPGVAGAEVFCDYVDAAPAGPAGNVLAVTATGDPELFEAVPDGQDDGSDFVPATRVAPRDDGTISVTAPEGRIACAGGEPTLTNVDGIRIVSDNYYAFVLIDLADGLLAPGATDEGNGSSEIEVAFIGTYGALAVRGGAGSDRFAVTGPGRGTPFGVNLNPRVDGEDRDLDVTAGEYSVLGLFGGGGADRFTVHAAARPLEEDTEAYLYMNGGPGDDALLGGFEESGGTLGGRGDDRLRAGPGGNLEGGPGRDELHAGPAGAHLQGGDGRDALFGGEGDDRLEGDGGRDRLIGGAGRDSIQAEDGEADAIDCGPGRDRVLKSDHADRRRRCEPWRRHQAPSPSDVEEAVEEAIAEAEEAVDVSTGD